MEKNLNEVQEKVVLSISCWWGLSPTPGNRSIMITTDKKLYHYHHYYRLDSFLKENNIPEESLSDGIKLSDDQYERVISFIENEIVDHTFPVIMIFDAGYDVKATYKGVNYNIVNNVDYETKNGLYDKAERLIKEIEGEIKNEEK